MKTLFGILVVLFFITCQSFAQDNLRSHWKLIQVFDEQNNKQLFSNLQQKSTIEFMESTCSGRFTCNSFDGGYKATQKEIVFSHLGVTLIGCSGDREELEGLLHKTLYRGVFYTVKADTLILTDNKSVRLVYTKYVE